MNAPASTDLIDKLACAVASHMARTIPIDLELWTVKEIGEYLKIAPNKVVERYASLPDFPKRIELPNSSGGKSHPRWLAREVIRWVEGYAG